MSLKRKITKEEFDKLSEAFKEEYKESNGQFYLDIDQDGVDAMKLARDHEKEARKQAELKLKTLEEEIENMKYEGNKNKGNIEAIEKSWNEKHSKTNNEWSEKLSKLQNSVKKSLIVSTAKQLANDLFISPNLHSRFIEDRLSVDFDSEVPTIRILDNSGKPSALTVEELKQEFKANKEFAPILIGSKASGGSAPTNPDKKPFASGDQSIPNKPFHNMKAEEFASHVKTLLKGE